MCICRGTFKIKHNFYKKNINNLSIFYYNVNVISHILKFLPKFNTTYDHFIFLIFNKIECLVIFVM